MYWVSPLLFVIEFSNWSVGNNLNLNPTFSALTRSSVTSIVVPVSKMPAMGKNVIPSNIYSTCAPSLSNSFTVKVAVS
jgi:hypothetical protein